MAKNNQRYFKLENNAYIQGRNAANTADVDVIKLNASDAVEFASLPKVGAADILISTDKGAANGVAPLNGSGKIDSSYLEALALTDVNVVADITARDALTVQEGDVAVVTDASADPSVTSGSASYIYDGAAWQRLGLPDEARLNEIDANVNDLITLSGVAENATDLGTFTGATIADSSTVKVALQALETAHEEVDQNVNDLITLSGVAENATNLGTFTGATIADSSTIKAALQSLETAVEAATGSSQGRQVLTLTGTDITNGYVDLAQEALANSVQLSTFGVVQEPGVDFTESVPVAVTRITFAGDLLANAAAGDKLVIYYEY